MLIEAVFHIDDDHAKMMIVRTIMIKMIIITSIKILMIIMISIMLGVKG